MVSFSRVVKEDVVFNDFESCCQKAMLCAIIKINGTLSLSSYGLSLCAERNAMSNAIVAGEKGKLVKIAIYSNNRTNCMPCGACRQWMAEFKKDKDLQIILESEDSKCAVFTIEELLPYGFEL